MRHNLLADAMITIKNAENVGKSECLVPNSELIKNVLDTMKKAGYIDGYRLNKRDISVVLSGKINSCRSISPRHSCKYTEFEKFEKRYLPTKLMGIIILTTSSGVVDHREAKEKKLGGKLLAFVY
ncbi:MAG: 30S ribosomal protein S8 [Candidatus Aenigmarchaeota archaeon]|nr:30S ribosomal protein S8 [Candidatus Aenigmarchaeota archaeon]